MEVKFYRCNHCGNIVLMVHDANVNPVCCGEPMELLVADSTDAATEKHVPVVPHPMLEEHYIEWICLANGGRLELHYLSPGEKPETDFHGTEHGVVYAYCNLHGLWKADF